MSVFYSFTISMPNFSPILLHSKNHMTRNKHALQQKTTDPFRVMCGYCSDYHRKLISCLLLEKYGWYQDMALIEILFHTIKQSFWMFFAFRSPTFTWHLRRLLQRRRRRININTPRPVLSVDIISLLYYSMPTESQEKRHGPLLKGWPCALASRWNKNIMRCAALWGIVWN